MKKCKIFVQKFQSWKKYQGLQKYLFNVRFMFLRLIKIKYKSENWKNDNIIKFKDKSVFMKNVY